MRKFNKGQKIGAVKQAARGAADRAYRDQVRTLQPKFQPGADPLEREASIKILEPTDAQQLQQMTKMLEKLYQGGTKQERQALELWKMQVAQGTIRDQVKLDFMRRFYFWLLGRGDQADHDKTLWGRANTAVYNKEVASYIDMFVDKRTKYVMKLRALANNVPDTLNGMYLYYKYIVNGQLKQVKAADGTIAYEMSDEDYLQDFDLFQQVFDSTLGMNNHFEGGKVGYSDLAAGLPVNGTNTRAFDSAGVPAPINNSGLSSGRASDVSLNADKIEENNRIAVRESLSLGSGRSKNQPNQPRGWEQRRSIGSYQPEAADPNASDLNNTSINASSTPQGLGVAKQEVDSIGNERVYEPGEQQYEDLYDYLRNAPEDERTEWLRSASQAQIAGLQDVDDRRRLFYGADVSENNSETDETYEKYEGKGELQKQSAKQRTDKSKSEKTTEKSPSETSEASKVLRTAKELKNVPGGLKSLSKKEAQATANVLNEKADRLSDAGQHEKAWEARALALGITNVEDKLALGREILAKEPEEELIRRQNALARNELSHEAIADSFLKEAASKPTHPRTQALLLAMAEKSAEYVEQEARTAAEQHERFERLSIEQENYELAQVHQQKALEYRQRQMDADIAKHLQKANVLEKNGNSNAAKSMRDMAAELINKK